MELLDLVVEIERYMTNKGLTHSDSIESLIDALSKDAEEDC